MTEVDESELVMQELKFREMRELKDIYLARKQGEALERITRPYPRLEGLGLGNYGPTALVALAGLIFVENIINELTGLTDLTIHDFVWAVDVGSGARQAKRMEKSLETIGALGQYFPMPQMMQLPRPERLESIKPG